MSKYNSWSRQEMTGTMGVTTVPLPAFWFSSKNEGDQLRRSPRKEHICQNPRCAANDLAYSTPYSEPPIKRIKGSFKNVRPNNGCPVSSNGTPTESETCGGIKAHGRHAGKYADCDVASSPRPTETCGRIKAHRRQAGACADCNVDAYPRPTGKPRGESCLVHSLKGSTGMNPKESTPLSGINRKELTGIYPNDSKRSTGMNSKESARLTGINPREFKVSTKINSKESTRLTGLYLNESTRSARLNSKEFTSSTGMDSIESTTSISSSSHAPSISTPRRSPPKPSKIALGHLSVRKGSTSTESSSPGCSQGTTQSLPISRLSESMDRSIAGPNLTPSFLKSGRMAPPNSERDEEELPSIKELDSLTLPQFHGLPVGSSSTPNWPPLATTIDPIVKPINPAPTNHAPTSIDCLPVRSSSNSSWPPTLPTDVTPISRAVNVASKSDSRPSNLPAAPLSSIAATMPPEATTTGIRAMPIRSSSPTMNKLSEDRSGSGFRHAPSITEHVKCRRTPALPKSRESDLSTRSPTVATTSNAAQMCILEQRLEDEDHRSNASSLNTATSDSSTESCSIGLGTLRGAEPVSAFYNALYAPDCTLSGTTALEAHLHWQNRNADRRLRVALEIAILSAMVTILVVVLYPALTRGLRSHFYGNCSCPVGPAIAASRNPSKHNSQLKSADGCAYRGTTSWSCLPEQQTRGSTVVK